MCVYATSIFVGGENLQKLANILRDKFQEVSKVRGIGHLDNVLACS